MYYLHVSAKMKNSEKFEMEYFQYSACARSRKTDFFIEGKKLLRDSHVEFSHKEGPNFWPSIKINFLPVLHFCLIESQKFQPSFSLVHNFPVGNAIST